ncbi:MAG: 3-hydroxyacyl-CoA dehydrogenase family protein, partial [Pseudomonadota bacterium]
MEIKKIGVLGAGVMGRGIAQVCAQNGFDVIFGDVSDETVNKGLKNIEANLNRLLGKGKISEGEKTATLSRIKTTSAMSTLKDADYVIEAVFEDMDLKKTIFKELDEIAGPEVILASNTSSLSITEMASVTKRPEKVVGIHFFNPVPAMKLVEIIKGYLTSEETISASRDLAEKGLRKEVVIARKDTPGFIVNRVFVPYLIEAIRLYEEGVASIEDIDKAVRLGLNYPMGPFELMDLMGNNTSLDVQSSLA